MPDIRLVDLAVIKRYSLAVRAETAPAQEVLDALDASRRAVLAALSIGDEPSPTTPRRPLTSRPRRPPAPEPRRRRR